MIDLQMQDAIVEGVLAGNTPTSNPITHGDSGSRDVRVVICDQWSTVRSSMVEFPLKLTERKKPLIRANLKSVRMFEKNNPHFLENELFTLLCNLRKKASSPVDKSSVDGPVSVSNILADGTKASTVVPLCHFFRVVHKYYSGQLQ